jgi:hypothetical protein
MLFDLQGKRRRVVQGTYLMLALLMGGGLALVGVGSDIQGGLLDAFGGGGSNNGSGNSVVQKRVDANEKKVAVSPRDAALRKALSRDYYQLATGQASADGTFPSDAKDELRKSAANWQAYLALNPPKPDASLARVALQVYNPGALNKPSQAEEAARLIAQEESTVNAYLNLVQYATLAKDTRIADLAASKAVDLAPAAQRKQVRAQIKQLKQPPSTSGAQGATPQQ